MSTARISPSLVPSQRSYSKLPEVLQIPNLVQIQLDSFEWFKKEGLRDLFEEISPIADFTGNRMELRFLDYEFRETKYDMDECRERDMTFAAPLFVRVELLNKETGEKMEQSIFMGDFPLMTPNGTFIINGAERVVVSQLVRSPGVYFTVEEDPTTGRPLAFAKLIPNRGAWLEFETSNRDVLSVKVDRRRKVPITTLLRAVGFSQDEDLWELFHAVDTNQDHQYLRVTMDREPAEAKTERGALMEFYRRLRPGDPPNEDNARSLVQSLFFNPRRYDLGRVGRYKLNKRLNLEVPETTRVITTDDLVQIIRELIQVNNGRGHPDDIDHLGNRRVRAVGELIQNQFRIGLLRIERVIRERMTIIDPEQATPSALVNIRPVVAAIKEFFGGSQLSQFMDQTNPLAELTHKRRLSALGPGGLSRDRAGFDVRDVHYSHYGRICPIETPEGPNIGLIGSLATYGRVNKYGFIETPYRRVIRELPNTAHALLGRTAREEVRDENGELIVARDQEIGAAALERLRALPQRFVRVKPYVSEEVDYLSADQEEHFIVAQANSTLDEKEQFVDARVEARRGSQFLIVEPERVQFMDVAPKQIVSVATSLIPFLEHDDANRALMGSNMQRQAVPLVRPEAPLVGTGMELRTALDSGHVICADEDGVIARLDARQITLRGDSGQTYTYPLIKFMRSNQGTCINQRVLVQCGDRVAKGQPLADSSSTERGQLALGQNVLCAFMSWEGYNFEDAIIISESLVRDDKFTSI
ncbi:MAG: DNA-directed RNA polymerase subunit beta, partial [Chloroflexi bacterium]|nr:DNA-directed RNA polymerase subunit beta [Chloroflexota bacterium]